MNAYKYDDASEDGHSFKAIGVMSVQGDPVLAVVTVKDNKLVSTNVVHPSSSYMVEYKTTLLELLKQVLR